MGGVCSTPRKVRNAYKLWWENLKGRQNSEDLSVWEDNITVDIR